MDSAEEPKSLLFLSCDLVGSTDFKQKKSTWQRTFLSFYREFPEALQSAQKKLALYGGEFRLWKPVGDELIFVTRVSSDADVYYAVRTWLEAMRFYDEDTLKDEDLATKGGAFIATFPGPDSEASIPKRLGLEDSARDVVELNQDALAAQNSSDFLFDYFGPSIDTGFRVLGMCSQRYFTMSVEVTLAYSHFATVTDTREKVAASNDIRFMGRHPLKGVWRGREYPVFAVDRERSDRVHDALAALESNPVDLNSIRTVCQECCESKNWPSKLYLPDASNTAFHLVPEDPLPRSIKRSIEGIETEATDGTGVTLDASAPVDVERGA